MMHVQAVVNLARMLSRVVMEHAARTDKDYDVASFLHVANLLESAASELEILCGLRARKTMPHVNAPGTPGDPS